MPLTDDEWREAEPRESFVDIVHGVFADRDEAYSAEELYDEVGSELMVEEFETALEMLVHEGALEKRMYPAHGDDEQVTYYRATDGAGSAGDVGTGAGIDR